jgi:hypothetical protein
MSVLAISTAAGQHPRPVWGAGVTWGLGPGAWGLGLA